MEPLPDLENLPETDRARQISSGLQHIASGLHRQISAPGRQASGGVPRHISSGLGRQISAPGRQTSNGSGLPRQTSDGRTVSDFALPVPVRSTSFIRQTSPMEAGAVSDLTDYIFSRRLSSKTEEDEETQTPEDISETGSSSSSESCDLTIWTWHSCGLPLGGFFLAFLQATVFGSAYGFFLGYMGLDSNVMMSITALMKLPQVLLLPFGILTDCVPIRGQNRKPYFIASWVICSCALLIMSARPLPPPYYCLAADGSYDPLRPPCNPSIHQEKNWYVFPMVLLVAGVQLGCVAGEGLLLEYSQRETLECRGKLKAEFTIVTMAGALTSSAVIGFGMNGKEYLGTFDSSMSFNGLMLLCFIISIVLLFISMLCVYESEKLEQPALRDHAQSSWNLVQNRCLSGVLIYAFISQFFAAITTTAAPMVRSQWVQVKVLQQQLFAMGGMFMMMVATWLYKTYFLQSCWRRAILVAILTVTISDAIPTFLAVFDVVRNQYFYLGEEILASIPSTALALVMNLMVIELAEPGQEGLCYGLIGTVMHSSEPFAVSVSNQLSSLFSPSLSKPENYADPQPGFQSTVAWSFVLAYSANFLGTCALPLVPKQKADVKCRKEWKHNPLLTALVIGIPAVCLPYGLVVLFLTSQPQTACLRWVGGAGCD